MVIYASMKFWFYSNLAKHPEKPKLASMHFLTSPRGPGEYAAYSQTLCDKCAVRAMLQLLDLLIFGGDVTKSRFRCRRRLVLHDFIFCLGKL